MSCHTWGYKRIKDLTQQEVAEIRQECDNTINSLEKFKSRSNKTTKIIEYYKSNVEFDLTVFKFCKLHRYKNGELYLDQPGKNYDKYIRISNYPRGCFTSANQLIRLCRKNGWYNVYWFEKDGQLIRGNENIKEAKNRIRKMFNENKGVLIDFG